MLKQLQDTENRVSSKLLLQQQQPLIIQFKYQYKAINYTIN